MVKWNRNREGYVDNTAGIAIQRVSREERKDGMAKKRSCRRTVDENVIHEKAVKLRRMTDEQLVCHVEEQVEKARSEGFNQSRQKVAPPKIDISSIVDEIGAIKGIGEIKLGAIRMVLEHRLGVPNG